MQKNGVLLVISGFSGAGKGTIVAEMKKRAEFAYSVSATTRGPRPGEVDGKDYYFISRDAFEKRIENGELLEWNEYAGNYYGTPKDYTLDQINAGRDLILEIDPNGARQVKKQYPQAVTIFVATSDFTVLEERLRGRASETEQQIQARLTQARREIDDMDHYDYIVINEGLEKSVDDIMAIVRAAHSSRTIQSQIVDAFKQNR